MTDRKTLRLRLGEALRNLRMARGLTTAAVAVRMGYKPSSYGQISRWELGQVSLGADQLFAYLLAIDMSFADLDRELNPRPAASPRLQEIVSRLEALA